MLMLQHLSAQDTVLVYNNYKYKIGVKLIGENSYAAGRENFEKNRTASTGIQLMRKLNSFLCIESGLYYITKGHTYIASDSSWGYSVPIPFRYHNISIPLSIRYDSKIIYLTAGGYCDYLLNYSVARNEPYAGNVHYYLTDRKFNLGIIFTAGLEKQFSKTLSFFVEGRFLENITSTKEEYDFIRVGFGYFNSGVAIGINYKVLSNK